MARAAIPPGSRRLDGCVCTALRRTTRLLTRRYDEVLRPYRIRATQLPILVVANAREAVPVGRVADALGLDRTTLLRNVRPLVRRRLLSVSGGRSGRTVLQTTAPGRELLARVLPAWKRVQREVLREVRESRWAETLEALERASGVETAKTGGTGG